MMDYPSVYEITKRLTKEEFSNQRLSAAGWVHNSKLVDAILRGDYYNIMPLHIELCSTYICNFNCSWCSCRKSRFENAGKNSLEYEELCQILDECSKYNIGIQWTGGEPLCNKSTVDAISYGTALGIKQCLFTNGSKLTDKTIDELLASNLSFIRVSLNCSTPAYHEKFHGNIARELSLDVLKGIENLCHSKIRAGSSVSIGVSIVVDSNNINDLNNTIQYLSNLCCRNRGAIDYMILRAVNDDFEGVTTDKNDNFWNKYYECVNGHILDELRKENITIVMPNNVEMPHYKCETCLGCSVFSEVAPDGTMFLCSDKYGNKEYAIGNILEDDLFTIWTSRLREKTILQNKNCFSIGKCPHYSRGWYFNVLFNQIERLREEEKMNLVSSWISELQYLIPDLGHSFFI